MSYAKVPLSDVEAAPVPSLHELQCELSKIPEESTHPAAVASKAEESAPAATVAVVTMPETAIVSSTSRRAERYHFSSCCCGCSLSSGIWLMSLVDVMHALSLLSWAAFVMWAKINENKVDKQLENALEAQEEQQEDQAVAEDEKPAGVADEAEVEYDNDSIISQLNQQIDIQSVLVPLYVLFAAVIMYFACRGLKAARGDIEATVSYLRYRKWIVVFTAFTAIFSSGFVGAMIQISLSVYFFFVVKSHLTNLLAARDEAQTDAATASVVVVSTTSA